MTLVNEVLFPEGAWTLNTKGKATLAKIAPTLSNLPGQQVNVQGFTDNVLIGEALKARFPSNLALLSARADDVVRYQTSKGVTAATHLGAGLRRGAAGCEQRHAAGQQPSRRNRDLGGQSAVGSTSQDCQLAFWATLSVCATAVLLPLGDAPLPLCGSGTSAAEFQQPLKAASTDSRLRSLTFSVVTLLANGAAVLVSCGCRCGATADAWQNHGAAYRRS
ncbi:OmpA family protein [Variovorax sp. J22R24]|uniref:OmpA/MotB family protein n=1 Tax=Variovorax gracilis TaxID=3053502 RepID=UPI0025755F18|nr:OmpA family protein [Variovorax sp. J22R24]MDM0110316.1 OmpA family protein [Variovorax sp. J22R24]